MNEQVNDFNSEAKKLSKKRKSSQSLSLDEGFPRYDFAYQHFLVVAEKVEIEADVADKLNQLEDNQNRREHLHCESVSLWLQAIVDKVNLLNKNMT